MQENCIIHISSTEEWKRHNLLSKQYIRKIFYLSLKQSFESDVSDIIFNINISFVNDNLIKEYNKKFRNKDKATDVLSFGQVKCKEDFEKLLNCSKFVYLGDIVLSFETIKKDAIEIKKPFKKHLEHLIVHGILHLFGYDHIEDNEAEIMENLEKQILLNLN